MKLSAGILAFRCTQGSIEFLLVHPGGPLWRAKDEGSWSIPKGEYTTSEPPLAAAVREFGEETGFATEGPFLALTPLTQPSGKRVSAWAVEADFDAAALRSNTFEIEWPPRSGKFAEFPEVDRAGWFDAEEAKRKLLKGQTGFVDELLRILDERDAEDRA